MRSLRNAGVSLQKKLITLKILSPATPLPRVCETEFTAD
jgi:hypothetical protein